MKLRKQLLFVSLITLTLPWVGCQYIREMESTLRKGQTDALSATAKAVAARLGSDAELTSILNSQRPPPGSIPIYVHLLESEPIVDGYGDDWDSQGLSAQVLRAANSQLKARLIAGIRRSQTAKSETLFLFLRIEDTQRKFFLPTLDSPTASDHVILQLHAPGKSQHLLVYSTGPGDLRTAWLNLNGTLDPEYRVQGKSSEWRAGYQLELSLPLEWSAAGLGIEVVSPPEGNISTPTAVSNFGSNGELPPLVMRSTPLSGELEIFSRQGVVLRVVTPSGRPIAEAGELRTPDSTLLAQRHELLNWFYRFALGNKTLPSLDNPDTSGQIDTPELSEALTRSLNSSKDFPQGWYQQDQHKVARVAAPIFNLGEQALTPPLAVVIADQSADSLASLTSSAFYQLLFYSLVLTFAASFSLILYASWLSFRLRRLSRAAANAISESGKISESFPVFRSNDEIGDLSRNYATLLTRLREYTNYLRSLSSKLSHELRTPLAIVKSSLENLEHEPLSSKASTYAERAKEGTERLSSILNAMSAASHVEQAISAAELETIPCDELLTNLKGAYEDVYRNARFKLNIRDEDGPLQLQGSGELLVQMFDKLVDNAADFCPQDGLIELGLYRHQNTLVFTVHNQGPPLPKHMHGQLFDSMVSVRDKNSGPEARQHLGLGLYIVRLIADFHRGEVQCYNVPDNSGVIFEIRLPAA